MPPRYASLPTVQPAVVFADDLTGANDTGVQFARAGLRTRVCFDAVPDPLHDAGEIIVVDTDSRHCAPALAYQRVYAAACVCARRGLPILYKKIDSTLRGALGAELDAVIDACGVQLVVLSPAFPANGRTLLNGVLYLDGAPVAQSPFAHDPQRPVTESHLPTLLIGQSAHPVYALDLSVITAGAAELAARLAALRSPQGAIAVCDAVTDAHLAVIVEAAHRLGEGCLLAGAAGLARPLARQLAEIRKAPQPAHVLVVIGSLHPLARAQVGELVRQHAAVVTTLDSVAAEDGAGWQAWLAHTLRRLESIPPAVPIVLTTPVQPVSTADSTLLPRLAALAAAVMAHTSIWGVVATGGATVRALSESWGASGIALHDEIAPGIALGSVVGGAHDGLMLVTKAGGFGDDATLAAIVHHLHTHPEALQR
jgi:uncharacterized protein YgbK (DUF1537 family)